MGELPPGTLARPLLEGCISVSLRVFVAEWPRNQFFNLGFEEAFLRVFSGDAALRFWRNDRVVVIGRHQCAALEVDALALRREMVKLTRRFTGGGAVYHDLGNINYALVIRRGLGGVRGVVELFRLVGEAVASALESLGARGAYYRGLNDVEINGLKVSGLAGVTLPGRVFVHGALLVESDLSILGKVLRVSREKLSDKRFVPSRRKRVITLEEAVGRRLAPEEVYEAISSSIAEKLGLSIASGSPSREELVEALRLYREKYSKTEWHLKYLGFMEDSLPREELEALKWAASPDPEQEKVVEKIEKSLGG